MSLEKTLVGVSYSSCNVRLLLGSTWQLWDELLRPMEMSQMTRSTSLTMHPIFPPGKVVLASRSLPGILCILLISCSSPTTSNWPPTNTPPPKSPTFHMQARDSAQLKLLSSSWAWQFTAFLTSHGCESQPQNEGHPSMATRS